MCILIPWISRLPLVIYIHTHTHKHTNTHTHTHTHIYIYTLYMSSNPEGELGDINTY